MNKLFAILLLVPSLCFAQSAGVVLNGASNTASGDYSGVGGTGSVSAGVGGFVWGIGSRELGGGAAIGRNVRADGTDAHASGQGVTVLRDNGVGMGWQNLSSGMQGMVTGHQSNDRGIQGAWAHAIGSFVNTGDAGQGRGDAQRIELILRATTTDGAPTQLSSSALNYAAAISPNVTVLTVPDNGTMRVKGGVVAREPSTGLSSSWDLTALIKKVNGTTVLAWSTVTPEFADSGAAWGFNVGADTANGSLGMYATGLAGHTIQWVARVISIENVGTGSVSGPVSTCTIGQAPANPITSGTTVTLTATCNNSPTAYAWSTGATSAAITVAPAVTTAYAVAATNASGIGPSATDTVSVSTASGVSWKIVSPDLTIYTDQTGTTWRARDWNSGRMALLRNGNYEGVAPGMAYYPGTGGIVYVTRVDGTWWMKWTGSWVYMATGEIPPGY